MNPRLILVLAEQRMVNPGGVRESAAPQRKGREPRQSRSFHEQWARECTAAYDPCTWSNGINGFCIISIDGFICNECNYASRTCTGPSDCIACGGNAAFDNALMCNAINIGEACTYNSVTGTCTDTGECQNSVQNDPVIQGFDGRVRNYDEVGDFLLLQEGPGRKVDVTFSGVVVEVGEEQEPQEKSWTTAVRFTSPNGDAVSCSLPGVQPNTSAVTVTATPAQAGSDAALLTSAHASVEMEEMSVTAVLSWKEFAGVQYSSVVGCKVVTPAYTATVYQVSGWEEAQAKPEEHGWAAPFTWLNLGLTVTARLEAPVTGILGDTYPKDLPPRADQAESLDGRHGEGAGLATGTVSLDGEGVEAKPPPPPKRRQRALSKAPNSDGVFTAHLGMGGGLW